MNKNLFIFFCLVGFLFSQAITVFSPFTQYCDLNTEEAIFVKQFNMLEPTLNVEKNYGKTTETSTYYGFQQTLDITDITLVSFKHNFNAATFVIDGVSSVVATGSKILTYEFNFKYKYAYLFYSGEGTGKAYGTAMSYTLTKSWEKENYPKVSITLGLKGSTFELKGYYEKDPQLLALSTSGFDRYYKDSIDTVLEKSLESNINNFYQNYYKNLKTSIETNYPDIQLGLSFSPNAPAKNKETKAVIYYNDLSIDIQPIGSKYLDTNYTTWDNFTSEHPHQLFFHHVFFDNIMDYLVEKKINYTFFPVNKPDEFDFNFQVSTIADFYPGK
jgi:hypothetical protein